MRRAGADVGGTFTDVVVSGEDGRVTFAKVLSTPRAYDAAVVDAVRSLGGADEVVHGTTVATNDVLELRRMRMPHLYDYFWTKPTPLVERHLRFEVAERMLPNGNVGKPLDEVEAR